MAREHGIPAVMGTGNATARIRDGHIVTVDGTQGYYAPFWAGAHGDGAEDCVTP